MRRANDQRIRQILDINQTAQIAHRGQRQRNAFGQHLEHLREVTLHTRSINQRWAHNHDFQAGFLSDAVQRLLRFPFRNSIRVWWVWLVQLRKGCYLTGSLAVYFDCEPINRFYFLSQQIRPVSCNPGSYSLVELLSLLNALDNRFVADWIALVIIDIALLAQCIQHDHNTLFEPDS